MGRISRMIGVTLLEIMLVLAIAAMVIVMSIRYYSSATTSQQTNTVISQVQAISAAMDNLAVGNPTGYSGLSTAAGGDLEKLVGVNNMKAPWGTTYTVAPVSATTYTITLASVPAGVCAALNSKVKATTHFASTSACAGGTLTINYDSTL